MLEDSLQEIYLNSNDGLKIVTFNVFEQELCEVVRSGHVPTVLDPEKQILVQSQSVRKKCSGSTAQYEIYCLHRG